MVILCLLDCTITDLHLWRAIRCCTAVGRGRGSPDYAFLACGRGDLWRGGPWRRSATSGGSLDTLSSSSSPTSALWLFIRPLQVWLLSRSTTSCIVRGVINNVTIIQTRDLHGPCSCSGLSLGIPGRMTPLGTFRYASSYPLVTLGTPWYLSVTIGWKLQKT